LAGGGGAGAKLPDVLRCAACPGVGAGQRSEAEVAADVGDDIRSRTGAGVVVEVGGVRAVQHSGMEGVGVGGFAIAGGVAAAAAVAVLGGGLDHVLVCAPGAAAGGRAGLGRAGGMGSAILRARAMLRRTARAMRSKATVRSGASAGAG